MLDLSSPRLLIFNRKSVQTLRLTTIYLLLLLTKDIYQAKVVVIGKTVTYSNKFQLSSTKLEGSNANNNNKDKDNRKSNFKSLSSKEEGNTRLTIKAYYK